MIHSARHIGHEVVVTRYVGRDGEKVTLAAKCLMCDEVLIDCAPESDQTHAAAMRSVAVVTAVTPPVP